MSNDCRSKHNVLIACASFKGTLTSLQAGNAIARGFDHRLFKTKVLPIADGGEGLVTALSFLLKNAKIIDASVRGPLWYSSHNKAKSMVTAQYALIPGTRHKPRTAIIEMASSSGIWSLKPTQLNPLIATTLGVGDQIRSALDHGARRIIIGLGGSATNDGGAGMILALGARLLDNKGQLLAGNGQALLLLKQIDLQSFDKRIAQTEFIACCDVDIPLCGPTGASHVFGPQKGATPDQILLLDKALRRYAFCIKRDMGIAVLKAPGSGAAGGLGAGCLAFLNAKLRRGIEVVLDTIGFDALLQTADLVITGEGRLDRQTLMGKAPGGIAFRAAKADVPCIALGGGIEDSARVQLLRKFNSIYSLTEYAGSYYKAKKDAASYLEQLSRALSTELSMLF